MKHLHPAITRLRDTVWTAAYSHRERRASERSWDGQPACQRQIGMSPDVNKLPASPRLLIQMGYQIRPAYALPALPGGLYMVLAFLLIPGHPSKSSMSPADGIGLGDTAVQFECLPKPPASLIVLRPCQSYVAEAHDAVGFSENCAHLRIQWQCLLKPVTSLIVLRPFQSYVAEAHDAVCFAENCAHLPIQRQCLLKPVTSLIVLRPCQSYVAAALDAVGLKSCEGPAMPRSGPRMRCSLQTQAR